MQKLKIDEWVIQVVKSMYDHAQSKVRIANSYSNPVNVSVGVHQRSLLSPLLFIIVMEALSRDFRIGCPWELLYAHDLVIVAESLEELKIRLKNWKSRLEEKGLKVNVGKTKVLCSRHDATKSKIASISLANCGKVFKACVRTVLLHGSETWPISTEDLAHIKRCDHAMICWICNVKIE